MNDIYTPEGKAAAKQLPGVLSLITYHRSLITSHQVAEEGKAAAKQLPGEKTARIAVEQFVDEETGDDTSPPVT